LVLIGVDGFGGGVVGKAKRIYVEAVSEQVCLFVNHLEEKNRK
jgi:hypothetical protein